MGSHGHGHGLGRGGEDAWQSIDLLQGLRSLLHLHRLARAAVAVARLVRAAAAAGSVAVGLRLLREGTKHLRSSNNSAGGG
eukprot:4358357-Prymnesium_polylepis.1